MMKMNEETQALYSANGYSPYAGCLPMLVQLPIIMGLYYVITEPLRFVCGIFRTDAKAFKEFAQYFIDNGLVKAEKLTDRTLHYDIMKYIRANPDAEWASKFEV